MDSSICVGIHMRTRMAVQGCANVCLCGVHMVITCVDITVVRAAHHMEANSRRSFVPWLVIDTLPVKCRQVLTLPS